MLTSSPNHVRLQPLDRAALDDGGVLQAPCLIIERCGAGVRVRGDAEWTALSQPTGVGGAGWRWDGERLHAHTDRYGFRALFYRRLAHGIAVSPSLVRLLWAGGAPTIDEGALGVFLRLGFFIGDDTPFRDIRVLPPAGRLEWHAGETRVDGSYARGQPVEMTRDAALDAYIDAFRSAVRRLATLAGPHVVPLSGGRDSRHILFELCALGVRPARCLTLRNYPPRGSRDVEIASELARALGLPHEIVEEYPSRTAAELRKNVITHFCADEHAWFLSLADMLDGAGVTVWDGIAGDVLSNGHRLDATRLALARAGRADELARTMLNGGLLRSIPRATAVRFGRDAAAARLATELCRHFDAPNPLGSFSFWNRTRREIALVPFGMWDRAGRVATPYLDPEVFDLLTGLPAEMFIDRRFHVQAIRRAFPQYATLRFDTDSVLPAVRVPGSVPADARYYKRLLREAASYVWRAPSPTYVRRAWVAARAAYWALTDDYSDAQLMPFALYLAQLETITRWAGANGGSRDRGDGHS